MRAKLSRIDERLIYLFITLCLVIPIAKPIGMPVSVNKDLTLPFYTFIENLKKDDIVLFDVAYGPGNDTELTPMLRAVFEHCARKGVKVVVGGQWESGLYFTKPILQEKAEKLGLTYGVDWVNIGFKPGGTATWRVMAKDFWKGAMARDIDDRPFEELPLMEKVKALDKDTFAAIIIFTTGSPGASTWITYFPEIPLLAGEVAVQVSAWVRYVQTGQMRGMIPGMRGAAEYEKLIEQPGVATRLMDAQSLSHLLIIILIILGNVGYLSTKGKSQVPPVKP